MSGNCPKCGTYRERLQRDHIIPRWRWKLLSLPLEGLHAPENIQFICANCHEDKTREERNRVRSPEHRAAISVALKGKEFSRAHRASLSVARLGKKHSPETRAKISETKQRNRELAFTGIPEPKH